LKFNRWAHWHLIDSFRSLISLIIPFFWADWLRTFFFGFGLIFVFSIFWGRTCQILGFLFDKCQDNHFFHYFSMWLSMTQISCLVSYLFFSYFTSAFPPRPYTFPIQTSFNCHLSFDIQLPFFNYCICPYRILVCSIFHYVLICLLCNWKVEICCQFYFGFLLSSLLCFGLNSCAFTNFPPENQYVSSSFATSSACFLRLF